jgi:hypothetical protein
MSMSIDHSGRREFLKTAARASLAGVAVAATGASAGVNDATAALARRRKRSAVVDGMPLGMTLLSIRSKSGDTLGVKTDRGILDVRRASLALHLPVPLTLDDLLQQGGAPELARLVAAAPKSRHADSLYVDEAQITHGRLFAEPGKIVCIGLNYREHASEAGEKVPAVPILFNKYNNALTSHGATIRLPTDVATKFDYEVELLVVIGKRAHNVAVEDARKYIARSAARARRASVDDRQDARRFCTDRSVLRERRSGRGSEQPQYRMPRQRRDASALQYQLTGL